MLGLRALSKWEAFQLKLTGGAPLPALAGELDEVVDAYDAYADENDKQSDSDYYPLSWTIISTTMSII